jgi:hypothetical protein
VIQIASCNSHVFELTLVQVNVAKLILNVELQELSGDALPAF